VVTENGETSEEEYSEEEYSKEEFPEGGEEFSELIK
jgi:hypothetical protein